MAGVSGLSHPPVEVSAAAFRDAVSHLPGPKRPRGSIIPRDTLLQPNKDGIYVETPIMSSLVPTTAPWRVAISVNAKRLAEVCADFRKIGAYKSKDDRLTVSVESGLLKVKYLATAVTIPIL